jgi:hypothetical protein
VTGQHAWDWSAPDSASPRSRASPPRPVPHGARWIPVRDQGGGLRRQVCAFTTHDASPAARAMVRALQDEATHSV